MEEIKDIIEILELAVDEINNNDINASAVLDLQDLKALKNLYNLYIETVKERDGIYNDYQDLGKENLKLQGELEQEKEKTPESVRKQFETYQDKICELEEKNKELEEHQKQYIEGEIITAKQGKFFEKMIKENYIHKDKIKEKITEYEKMVEGTFMDNTWHGQNRRNTCYEIIKVLEDLLEEKENV